MYNFFVNHDHFNSNKVVITGEDVKHIKNVLRMEPGTEIYVVDKDESKKYLSKIENITSSDVVCEVIKEMPSTELPVEVTLFQGLPKFDKLELIIQKATELGASYIVPVDMRFCIAKMNNEDKKLERWNKISEAAAKQSKRNFIPLVEKCISFKQLVSKISDFDLAIVAYEDEDQLNFKDILKNSGNDIKKIAIIVGPEGGIDSKEINELKEAGVKVASLGKRILRTETAGIAMLSMITYEFEL